MANAQGLSIKQSSFKGGEERARGLEDKIEAFYLPSYSPELNPDELLNVDLKQHVTKAASARNEPILIRSTIGALRSVQKRPDRV